MEPANAAVVSTGTVPELSEPTENVTKRGPLVTHPVPVAVVAVAIAAVSFACYSPLSRSLLAAFFAAVLVVLGAIDLEHRIIPNRIVLPATAVVLVAHILISPGRTLELVVAPLAAAAFLFAPNLINSSAMGMGDVKLALLLGAGLGWGVVGALLVGFIATLPVTVVLLVRGGRAAGKATLPLGPFLAFGGLVILIVPKLT
jgi:leader peptidase (prepilin peptidase) / N-methyltransferase